MEEFNIASNSKRLVIKWYCEGRLTIGFVIHLFDLHPEWREA